MGPASRTRSSGEGNEDQLGLTWEQKLPLGATPSGLPAGLSLGGREKRKWMAGREETEKKEKMAKNKEKKHKKPRD